MMKNKKLLVALIIPIACLLLLTAYKAYKVYSGRELVVPITGFDPRDLLSGHYLIYRLDLKVSRACRDGIKHGDVLVGIDKKDNGKLKSRLLRGADINRHRGDYDFILRGTCRTGRFTAGVEKFFIPEKHAAKLDTVVRKGKGKVVLSIDYNGKASLKDLLIDDKSWREYVKE